jgi:hypothetical protein
MFEFAADLWQKVVAKSANLADGNGINRNQHRGGVPLLQDERFRITGIVHSAHGSVCDIHPSNARLQGLCGVGTGEFAGDCEGHSQKTESP